MYREPGHHAFSYGNVAIVFSSEEPDSTYMERNALAMTRLSRNYAAGLGALVMIPESARPPSEASRDALRAGYNAIKRHMRGLVLVIEGEGFAASAKRSVATLLGLVAPLPFPMKVAGGLEEAADQLIKMLRAALDPQLNAPLLAAAAAEARRKVSAP